jgi:hypothetical protein
MLSALRTFVPAEGCRNNCAIDNGEHVVQILEVGSGDGLFDRGAHPAYVAVQDFHAYPIFPRPMMAQRKAAQVVCHTAAIFLVCVCELGGGGAAGGGGGPGEETEGG